MDNRYVFNLDWAAGFIEGQGSFTVNVIKLRRETRFGLKLYEYHNPVFFIVNRDRAVLEKVRELLGMGKINRHGAYFHLDIRKKSEVIRLVKFLDGKIISGKRAEQFERWKGKVLEWKTRARGEGVMIP